MAALTPDRRPDPDPRTGIASPSAIAVGLRIPGAVHAPALDGAGPVDQVAEVDLSLSMGGGVKHYVCSGGRVAFCGLDLRGAHICPADLSCGCVVCPDCDRVHHRTLPACPLTGGPCDCV